MKHKTKEYVSTLPYAKTSKIKVVDPSQIWDGNPNKFIGSIVQSKVEFSTVGEEIPHIHMSQFSLDRS